MILHRRHLLLALGSLLALSSSAPVSPEQARALTALAESRHQAALAQFEEAWIYYRQARTDPYPVYTWSRLALEAQHELGATKADRIAALEAHRERMARLATLVKKVRALGFSRAIEVGASRYYMIEADYWLAVAKAE